MMGQIGRRRLKHMAYFPHNIFAEFWYCTGGYRARAKASKGRVKSTSLSLEMLRKQRPSEEDFASSVSSRHLPDI